MKFKKYLSALISITLLSSCSFLEYHGPGYEFSLFDGTGYERLARAVKQDNVRKISRELRRRDIDVNFQEEKFGNTLLGLSIVWGKKRAFQTLLESGADPNLQSRRYDKSALHIAAGYASITNNCDTFYIKALLEKGADPNLVRRFKSYPTDSLWLQSTVLIDAIGKRYDDGKECVDIVKILVEAGADIDVVVATGSSYETAVGTAVIIGALEAAKYFIIERKCRIPEFIGETIKGRRLIIEDILDSPYNSFTPRQVILRKEILDYLENH